MRRYYNSGEAVYESNDPFERRSIQLLILFVALVFAAIIFLGSTFRTITNDRRLPPQTSTKYDRALRGSIVSQDGYTLSRSNKSYQATVFAQSIDGNKRDLFVSLFSIYSGISKAEIHAKLESKKGYVVLAKNLNAVQAINLRSLAYKLRKLGIFRFIETKSGLKILHGLDLVESGENREYPLHNILSPTLGYVQKKRNGRYTEVAGIKGLERYYEKYLISYKDGFFEGKRDVSGTRIRNKLSVRRSRIDGYDIHLNIPLLLQRRIELTLDAMKQATSAKEIIAGIMESGTGRVVALATSQRYDPGSITAEDIKKLNPKFGSFLYEPGSVIKPLTLALALEYEKATPHTWIETDGGKLKISEKYTITDDKIFDILTAEDIIVHSSNVGISKIAWRLSGKELHDGLLAFGLGSPSGLDLYREKKGKIKSARVLEKRVDKANQAYGYGMMATFAQIWKAYSSFNNNGIAVTPRIINYLKAPNGKIFHTKPTVFNLRVLHPKTAHAMKKILIKTVQEGTGKSARYPGLIVGGKTGTAHIVKEGRYVGEYNSGFFGFVNDNQGNRYTIGVLALGLTKEHKYFASQTAAPAFRKIIESMVELELLRPDLTLAQKQKQAKRERAREAVIKRKQRQRAKAIKEKLKRERRNIWKRRKTETSPTHSVPPATPKKRPPTEPPPVETIDLDMF